MLFETVCKWASEFSDSNKLKLIRLLKKSMEEKYVSHIDVFEFLKNNEHFIFEDLSCRRGYLVDHRRIYCYLCAINTKSSDKEIGVLISKDRATVHVAKNKAKDLMYSDKKYNERIEEIDIRFKQWLSLKKNSHN